MCDFSQSASWQKKKHMLLCIKRACQNWGMQPKWPKPAGYQMSGLVQHDIWLAWIYFIVFYSSPLDEGRGVCLWVFLLSFISWRGGFEAHNSTGKDTNLAASSQTPPKHQFITCQLLCSGRNTKAEMWMQSHPTCWHTLCLCFALLNPLMQTNRIVGC